MSERNRPDISVIICTFNRADSLRETLKYLAGTDRSGLVMEVVIVDNGSTDDTPDVSKSFANELSIRFLQQPTPGKVHSLNHALEVGQLGDLVVLLDDDMSVRSDWSQGVLAISNRHPDCDFFTGRTLLAMPYSDIPEWARHRFLKPWAFSFIDYGDQDVPVPKGKWLSGNHYWFRSRVLEDGRKFLDLWNSESNFILQLAEDGMAGRIAPDAVVEHRVQPELLNRDVIWERSKRAGKAWAHHRLPYFKTTTHGRRLHDHPWWARVYFILNGLRYALRYLRARMYLNRDRRFAESCVARVGFFSCVESLKIASQVERHWKDPEIPFWLEE